MKPLFTFVAAVLLVTSAANAQEVRGNFRILVYGADSVAQCAEPVRVLQTELATLQFPAGWTFGVVCNRVAWNEIRQIADSQQTDTAFSNLIRRSTVINAAIFSGPRARYRHTLAHELGHAVCHCASEAQAEAFARRDDQFDRSVAKALRQPSLR